MPVEINRAGTTTVEVVVRHDRPRIPGDRDFERWIGYFAKRGATTAVEKGLRALVAETNLDDVNASRILFDLGFRLVETAGPSASEPGIRWSSKSHDRGRPEEPL